MERIQKHRYILLVSFSFALLYALVSLVNHYFFRTYALDLGLYTHAAFQYAHFQPADSLMIKEYSEPMLGGHFDLYLILFSPFIYVFGSYTLLIVQIIAVIAGGIGIYHYFQILGVKNKNIPLIAALYFFVFFGVFGAFSNEYHSVVVAASIVPWFFVSVHNNKKVLSALLLVLMLVSQENISLWLFFICLGMAIETRKEVKKFTLLLLFSSISIVYFITVISFVIPSFSSQDEYGGFLYSVLGHNAFDALKTLIVHPVDSLMVLFTNHNNHPHGDFVKAELHLILLASGLPLLIKKPQYLLMLLPIYFQKLFHNNYLMWGIGSQYNIEFAPIMAIGIFKVISEIKQLKFSVIMSFVVLFFVTASTIRTMDQTVLFTDKARVRFYQKNHYERNYDVKIVHHQLKKIPKDAKVSAQSPYVPHLSLRNNIYQFPIIRDADYIIYSKKESSYPITQEEFELKINTLEQSEDWKIIYQQDITILKKTGSLETLKPNS